MGQAAQKEATPPSKGRLPRDVKPTAYTLALEVVPERETFSGTVEIEIALERPRDTIWLHGRGLKVREASVAPAGKKPFAAVWEQVAEDGMARLQLPRVIGPGRATIRIAYQAAFDPQQGGLYRVREGGEAYAFTQFEQIYARRTLPCFDEPSFKAPFTVTLTVPAGQRAIANQPEIERTAQPGGLERVRFSRTPPLPTYLLALAVGPLDVVEAPAIPPGPPGPGGKGVRSRAVPLRGVTTRGKGPRLAYALAHTPELLQALEAYFGTEYPYDKLDLIAIPDFPIGAMENAGAITFLEELLLLDERTAPANQKRQFTGITTHELAHQWFGDLVTMAWWDDIWLNESFATWMATRIADRVHPEVEEGAARLWASHLAMNIDSLVAARRVRQPIESYHDIENALDEITYEKGGRVLTMFEHWLGEDAFQRGVRQYLASHRQGNATAEDFLAALSEAAGRDVAATMQTFLSQTGVPLVTAELVCDPASSKDAASSAKGARLLLRQSRYLPVGSTAERDRLWQVPVCARYESGGQVREACTLLAGPKGEGSLALEGGCPRWVFPNSNAAGYYRWSLPARDLERLRQAGYERLSVLERMSLADNLRAAFMSGALTTAETLMAMAPLARDEHPRVASIPIGFLDFLHDRLVETPLREAVATYGRELYRPLYKQLGWGEPVPKAETTPAAERARLLRREVISFLRGTVHDPEVQREAARRGRSYLGYGGDGAIHAEAVDANLVDPALEAAAAEGDRALYDAMLERLFRSDDALLRGRLLQAAGAVTDPALAERSRALTLEPRLFQRERMIAIDAQLAMPETQGPAWEWLKSHLQAVIPLLPETYVTLLPLSASSFCDAAHAEEAQAVFGPGIDRLPGGPRNLAEALERIRLCTALRATQGESARRFFTARRPR
ncbi:MAG TPA: M1 family metallopeptidase [Polyangia bacterium]|nr:M1 family metallopeptidase [Polyangia bacterium]